MRMSPEWVADEASVERRREHVCLGDVEPRDGPAELSGEYEHEEDRHCEAARRWHSGVIGRSVGARRRNEGGQVAAERVRLPPSHTSQLLCRRTVCKGMSPGSCTMTGAPASWSPSLLASKNDTGGGGGGGVSPARCDGRIGAPPAKATVEVSTGATATPVSAGAAATPARATFNVSPRLMRM